MNGVKEYTDKQQRLIQGVIDKNADKPYLVGFYNFIGQMSLASVYEYVRKVANFMNDVKKNPEELTVDDYSAYMFKIRDKTSSYRITTYSALKKFSDYLCISKRNESNPMQYIQKPKAKESQQTKEKREHAYLEGSEISRYIKNISESGNARGRGLTEEEWKAMTARDMALIMVLLNTGMRASALYKLDIDSINRDEMILTVTDKGDKVFTYNITDELMECIDNWLEVRDVFADDYEDALFVGTNGKRLGQTGISRAVRKYAKIFKDKKISPHKLRATYGTMIYKKTKDIRFTQMAMNHTNSATTELYIRGDSKATRKQAADIMSGIIFKK